MRGIAHNPQSAPDVGPTAASTQAREHRALGYLSLFSSAGTLLCCALPSLLVLLGLGATVASALASAPWLVSLSRHKGWVFAGAGLLVAANFYYVYRVAPRVLVERGACSPDDAEACGRASRTSRGLLWASAVLLLIGLSVAYALPVTLGWVET